ncbi:DUF4168 domain-containing protein [Acidithiobacillus sp. HP-2]|uniref:DUF4168 domain-containing protein n=1 Tax=Acidithiobacillus sp. HP-2 TaxID=2697654 RepID=UPI001879809E|nr:DUF4168 domain-containing protein [Acidithiobacillus sp. HP-2]MBE7570535.1 DUF4168 domain-containing protein [Acidithiobacillus sp. HP-2]
MLFSFTQKGDELLKSIQTNVITALGIFVFSTSVAFASMSSPMSTTQPQPSSPAMQNGASTPPMASGAPQAGAQSGSQPMMPSAPQAGPAVSNAEIMHFASALRAIEPLDSKMRTEAMQKGVSKAKQKALAQTYAKDVHGILAKNDLSASSYEMLMRKAHSDPQFAQKVEAAIKSGA